MKLISFFFTLCFINPQSIFSQSDSLPNKISLWIEGEKHSFFNGYSTAVQWAHWKPKATSVLRVFQSSRFNQLGKGVQMEIYPRWNKTNYGNISLTLSDGKVFPNIHAAAHWMHSFQKSHIETEIGFRYIRIPDDNLLLGVGGITKYWRNYFFNIKIYWAQGSQLQGQTYTMTMRRYFKDEVSFLKLGLGMAKSQEVSSYNSVLFNDFRTGASWIQIGWQQQMYRSWIVLLEAHFENLQSNNKMIIIRQTLSLTLNKLF